MTIGEAKKMLKAKLDCLTYETAGCNYDCNNHLCDECDLNYEQGNMGEQQQALDMAIKALEQESCEDCISREALMKLFKEYQPSLAVRVCEFGDALEELPSVKPQLK